MKPYESWKNLIEMEMTPQQYQVFWKEYLDEEKGIYEKLLKESPEVSGTIAEMAERFGVEETLFAGFLDGINTSLVESLDLDALEADTPFEMVIDYEKLYYNMHDAKAKWLFNLKDWETLLTKEQRREIKKRYRDSVMVVKTEKVGRNDPCPCGSGKKYKKCCMNKENA